MTILPMVLSRVPLRCVVTHLGSLRQVAGGTRPLSAGEPAPAEPSEAPAERSSEVAREGDAASQTPRKVCEQLDRHIVGQSSAKRAVAVALRNRWRRHQVEDKNLRQEITPKNILMIGPTGVGKTEIARRLAKLADAPFVKVEATKFTEVRPPILYKTQHSAHSSHT